MKPAELARYLADRLASEDRRKALLARPIRPRGQRSPGQLHKDRLMAEYDEKRQALKGLECAPPTSPTRRLNSAK